MVFSSSTYTIFTTNLRNINDTVLIQCKKKKTGKRRDATQVEGLSYLRCLHYRTTNKQPRKF